MPSPNPYLKRERQLRGWSQSYLAERIGVADHYISRWEHGRVIPSPYYRQKLCEVFGKTAEELGFLQQIEDPTGLAPSSPPDERLGSEGRYQVIELAEQDAITTISIASEPGNGVQPREKWSILLLAGLLVVLLTAGGTFAVIKLLNPSSPPPTTRIPACKHQYWQTGVTTDVSLSNFEVPQGCILVLDSWSGKLNGVIWVNGAVLAFSSGTYNGHIFNGEYELVAIDEAKQTFCGRVRQVTSHGYDFSNTQPLLEWGLSPEKLLKDGHC